MLKINDVAPMNIGVKNMNGEDVTLEKYIGKYLVLYFYPKDDTEACTVEACSFRDFNSDIEKLGAKVIGVSKDSLKSHTKFQNKYSLNFELVSDPDNRLMEAFGVWGEKSMFGKKYMGTLRTTFIINPEGKIEHVWEKVKAKDHAKEVYGWLRKVTGDRF